MAKKTPTISVIERRIQGGAANVHRAGSRPIPLKQTGWELYWCNTQISPTQLWDLLHVKGWVYCEPDDLDCPVEEIGAIVRDGRIVMGTRGDEVLLKMTTENWKIVQQMKTEDNIKQTFGKKQIKDAIVAGVAAEHGDPAAEYVAQNVNAIDVRDQRGPEDSV